MKYRLTNEYKNRVIYAESEAEKERLISKGFILDENYGKATTDNIKKSTSKKRKAVKEIERKAED